MDTSPISRHERRRMQTRKLLIQTTLQLVLEKGYDAISIQEITDRADLGRGTFYIHFKDKECIVWAAIQDLLQETEREAHTQFSHDMPPQVAYYGLLKIFSHAEKNRDLYRVIFGGQGSAMLTARVQDHLAQEYLRDMQAVPALSDKVFGVPNEIKAQLLTGAVTRLVLWWLETPNDYTIQQMAAMTFSILHHQMPPT